MNIIRASALGSCLKALVAGQLGYTPMDAPEKIQAAYDRGNEHEEECAAALRKDGWLIIEEQKEVDIWPIAEWGVVGHLDGIIGDGEHKPRVWEAKAPNAYDKFEKAYKTGDWSDPLAHRYAWQISAYMHATGLEAYVTSWDEERGVRGFGIEVAPFTMEDIVDRVSLIYADMQLGTIPPVCTQADWPCPFYYLHEDAEEVADDPVLDELVRQRIRFADQEKYFGEQKKTRDNDIREYLLGEDRVTQQSKVTFYEQQGAERWDDDLLRKCLINAGHDPEKFRVRGKPSERMKITRRDSE